MKLLPHRALNIRRKADIARDGHQWEQAASLYKKYLSIWPNGRKAAIWIQLGNVSKEAKQYSSALAAYRRASVLAPTDAEAHLQLGHLFKRMGAPGKSRAAYLHALRLNPASEIARSELRFNPGIGERRVAPASSSNLVAADRERDLRHWDRAAALYEAHLFQDGHEHDGSVWVQLGHMQKESGRNDRALQSYRKAVELEPMSADGQLQLGRMLRIMGSLQAANACYQKALEIDPYSEDIRIELQSLNANANTNLHEKSSVGAAGRLIKPMRDDYIHFDVQFPAIYVALSRKFQNPE